MRKQITTWMLMLLCCASTTMAQQVADVATDPLRITEGYYVLLAKTSEGTKTDEGGAFVYHNSSDSKIYYDAKGSMTNLLGKTVESVDEFKYFFYVKKNSDGTVTVRAWNTNAYWPSVSDAGAFNYHPGRVDQIRQASEGANFTLTAADDKWCTLSFPGTYYSWGTKNCTDYVVLNNECHVGYWDSSASSNGLFQFYAVADVPEADDLVTFTYNYTFNGVSKKISASRLVVIGHDFPDFNGELPDYVVANKPSRKVTAEDNGKSIEIVCTEDLPFKTSTDAAPIYYYLENVQGTRLYASSGLKFRTAAQASSVNDVRNDLWYVKGNPFDGFQFSSVAAGNLLHSSSALLNSASLAFSGLTDNTCTWDVFPADSEGLGVFSVCPIAGSVCNWPIKCDDSNKKNYSWKLNGNEVNFTQFKEGDASFAFRLVEPTFTFPMYPVGSNTYNSFAAPFDVEVVGDDIKMYKGALNAANKELVISSVDAAPANAGVVLMGENCNADMVTLKAVAGAPALEGNDLVGTTAVIKAAYLADKLIFGMADDGSEAVGFFAANGGVVSLDANHAYLLRETVQQVKGVSMRIEGEPTSIGSISSESTANGNDAIYDLAGRRVARTQRGGLYIQNGRKFIVK